MSELPDLDTGSISYIAFWNAIDDGNVSSIDPEDVTSDGNIAEYTVYDNGVEITKYNSATGRQVHARVKSDGWIMAWIDRTEDFGNEVDVDLVRGPWDVINSWKTFDSSNASITNNTLERVVSSLQAELSNSGTINYSAADVGLFNYMNPDNAATTYMTGWYSGTGGSTTGFSYTSETTIDSAVCCGTATSGQNGEGAAIVCEGTTAAGTQGGNSYYYPGTDYDGHRGSLDLLQNNLIPNSGTEYQVTTQSTYNDTTDYFNYNVLVDWH